MSTVLKAAGAAVLCFCLLGAGAPAPSDITPEIPTPEEKPPEKTKDFETRLDFEGLIARRQLISVMPELSKRIGRYSDPGEKRVVFLVQLASMLSVLAEVYMSCDPEERKFIDQVLAAELQARKEERKSQL